MFILRSRIFKVSFGPKTALTIPYFLDQIKHRYCTLNVSLSTLYWSVCEGKRERARERERGCVWRGGGGVMCFQKNKMQWKVRLWSHKRASTAGLKPGSRQIVCKQIQQSTLTQDCIEHTQRWGCVVSMYSTQATVSLLGTSQVLYIRSRVWNKHRLHISVMLKEKNNSGCCVEEVFFSQFQNILKCCVLTSSFIKRKRKFES